jgi:hypothetical protein
MDGRPIGQLAVEQSGPHDPPPWLPAGRTFDPSAPPGHDTACDLRTGVCLDRHHQSAQPVLRSGVLHQHDRVVSTVGMPEQHRQSGGVKTVHGGQFGLEVLGEKHLATNLQAVRHATDDVQLSLPAEPGIAGAVTIRVEHRDRLIRVQIAVSK